MAKKKQDDDEGCLGCLILTAIVAFIFACINLYLTDNEFDAVILTGVFIAGAGIVIVIWWTVSKLCTSGTGKSKEWWWSLSPYEFEHATAKLFRSKGYKAEVTQASSDGGIDVILKFKGQTFLVQCKQHKAKVGVTTVRELNGVVAGHGAAGGYLIVGSGVTKQARAEASKFGITILTIDDLVKW